MGYPDCVPGALCGDYFWAKRVGLKELGQGCGAKG